MRIVKWMKNGLHLKENSINMSRLYIIGNGFDIAHGIPCRYSDFRCYCKENMPDMYEKLNRYYDGGDKLWSDFESELPNLNKDALFDWMTINNPNWNQNWKGYYDFIDEVRDEVDYVEGLKLAFTEWVQAILLEDVRRKYDIIGEDSLFITFNYTLTLEKVYHIPAYRIFHIHGMVVGEFPKLVVGHNMNNAEVDNIFSSENDFEEEACKEVANLIKSWRKDTERIISVNEEIFLHIGNVADVYVLGHSMSDVDLPYFAKVRQSIPKSAKWHISVFDEVDRNNKQQIVDKLGLVNVDYFRMESLSLSNS